jgi:predicted ATP-grasp superfamily ATP-dependent carboligase
VTETCRRERVSAVLPLDEDIVRLLAERDPDLAGAVVAGPDAAQYRALCDKGRLGESARRAGVDHPFTLEIVDGSPVAAWPSLPCIVKPRISGSSGLWEKPMLARTAAERDEAVRSLLEAGIPALVQERLTGPRWVGHCVLSDQGFDFLGFRVDRDFPRGAGPASVMHTADVPSEVVEATRRLLDLVDYRGPCSLSFIQQGGRFLVHDVNLRLGATVEASVRSGFDIPGRSVAAALGRPVPPLQALSPTRYVRFDGELRELIRALRRRSGTDSIARLGSWLAAGLVSRRTVLDPWPWDPSWAPAIIARRVGRLRRSSRG